MCVYMRACVCVCVCVYVIITVHIIHIYCFSQQAFCSFQGMALEKKEARAEKDEAEKYQKLQQELVHT